LSTSQLVYLTADNELITLSDGVSLERYAAVSTSTNLELRLVMVMKTSPTGALALVAPPAPKANGAAGRLAPLHQGEVHRHARERDLKMAHTERDRLGCEFLAAADLGCMKCLEIILARHPDIINYEGVRSKSTAVDGAIFNKDDEVLQSETESS
jgi:hypothetical protein